MIIDKSFSFMLKKVTLLVIIHYYRGIWFSFFEDEDENAVTVNANCYIDKLHSFITDFHLPQKEIYAQSIETFQQDGARPHLTQAVFHTLTLHFPIIISQKTPSPPQFNWPPYSPDLSPLDYFVFSDMKSLLYIPLNPLSYPNVQSLKTAISAILSSNSFFEKVKHAIDCFPAHLDTCIEFEGAPFTNNDVSH